MNPFDLPASEVRTDAAIAVRHCCNLLLGLLVLFVLPAVACAAPAVVIQFNDHNSFTLLARNTDDITGGEIQIDYQSYSSTPPVVNAVGLGSQAGLTASTENAGTITVSLASPRPLRGGGYLAMIQVGDKENGPGRILGLSAVLKHANGYEESAGTEIINPPEDAEGKTPETAASSAAKLKKQGKQAEAAPEEIRLPGNSPADRLPSKSDSPPFRRLDGVLDRFRAYDGALTPAAIERLFARVGDGELEQEPAVLIADGATAMRVTIRPVNPGDEIRCFIVRGGHSTGLEKGKSAGEWVLHLVPERGSITTSVTVLGSREAVEYPLTVAPPLVQQGAEKDANEPRYVTTYVKIANEMARWQ